LNLTLYCIALTTGGYMAAG